MIRVQLLFFLFLLGLQLHAQKRQDILIDDKNNNSAFDLLEKNLDKKKYFFTGENHIYQKSNYLIQFKFTEYLHEKIGLNKILLEFGPGTGWLINEFVRTGDSLIFDELKKYFSTENLSLYDDLKKLNESNQSNQISCHGIDLERFPQISIAALTYMLPKTSPESDSLSVSIETLRAMYSVADEYSNADFYSEEPYRITEIEIYQSFELWMRDYDKLKNLYKKYLGDGFDAFNQTVDGLKAGKVWYNLKDQRTLQETIFREQYMYSKLKDLEEMYPNSKFYGQFGRCHIRTDNSSAQCYSYAMKSMIYKIGEAKGTDKIMILPIFYVRNVFLKDKKFVEKNIENFWAMNEAVYLVKLDDEIKISDEFNDKTSYILINNLKLTKDQLPKDPYRNENQRKKIPSLKFSAEVDLGVTFYNFDDLNNYLANEKLSPFKSVVPTIGGIFSVFSPYGIYYGMEFGIGLSQRVNTDSVFLKLNNYRVMFNIGTSILNTNWFSFNPSIGIGGGNFTLKEERIIPDPNSKSLFAENNVNYIVNKNPSFLIDVKGEMKFNIKIFSFSVRGGYLFDVTNKRWKNPQILPNSPKTGMMGWHIRAGFGINLKVY